jgi:hypothetical protein
MQTFQFCAGQFLKRVPFAIAEHALVLVQQADEQKMNPPT